MRDLPLHPCHYLLFISKIRFFFFFFSNFIFYSTGSRDRRCERVDFGLMLGCGFVCVTFLCPGCILNVAKFLSTVKFVVLNWCSLAIAVLSGLSGVAATEYA